MRIINKDTIALKEKIIALVDERDKLYVIPLLDDLENTIREHSFDSGYDKGCIDWHEMGSYHSD